LPGELKEVLAPLDEEIDADDVGVVSAGGAMITQSADLVKGSLGISRMYFFSVNSPIESGYLP
jgi:hypothetical protein